MTVTTRSPTTVVSSGAWVAVSNVYASDLLRATLLTSGSSTFTVGGFGLAELIGTDVVNSVTMRIQHFENQTNQNRLYLDLLDNGTVLAGGQQVTTRTTEGYDEVVVTGITNAQINTLQFRVEGAKQGGPGSRTFNVNHVEISIDHSPATPPAAPTLTATVISSSQINTSWVNEPLTDSTDLEVDGVILTGQASPYSHTGLLASTEHTYRVRGVNVAGPGAWSTLLTRTTSPPPNPPSNLAASAVSASRIDVTWTQPGDATSVDLEVDGVVETSATSPRQHTGLASGSLHEYRVRSVNAGGPGAWSSIQSASTWPDPPPAPTDFTATAVSHTQIDVTWTTPGTATSVDIEIDGIVQTGVTSPYSHTGLTFSTEYDYRVRGVNISGPGAWTSIVSETTNPLPPIPSEVDGGSPGSSSSTFYDAETPSSPYDQTMDGGGPIPPAPYTIRLNGVERTIAKVRLNGVDRTVAAFRINGVNL